MDTSPVSEPQATKASRRHFYPAVGFITVIIACLLAPVWLADKANTQTPTIWTTQATPVASTEADPVASRQESLRSELQQARAQWTAQPYSNYRVFIVLKPNLGPACEKTFEVHESARPKKLSDTCYGPSEYMHYAPPDGLASGPGLFDYIESQIYKIGQCGPNGCDCDGGITINVVYDSDHGYPRSVEERFEHFWPRAGRGTPCGAVGWIFTSPFTVTITPIINK